MAGRSIRLFLVDGSATGLRTAELGLSTIKALVVPRASFAQALKEREELKRTGVYMLVGADSDNPTRKRIYVGEGDVVYVRLSAHLKDRAKDFWEEAIIFTSKDENLTKAHVRYLEARLIGLAVDARRVAITNGTAPSEQGKLPEADRVEMEEFIGQARILLGTLGYDFFDTTTEDSGRAVNPSSESPEKNRLTLRLSGESGAYQATCEADPVSGQFIVKQGSRVRMATAPSIGKTYRDLREELLASGILKAEGEHLLLMQDYPFSSATAAAQVVTGFSINGRTAWKTDSGTSYAEWEEAQVQSEQQEE